MVDKKEIIEILKTCFDPEIPIDLWNLGLIYEIKLNNKTHVEITMTLTTPGCSMIDIIADDVKNKLSKIKNIKKVSVNVTFDPPWSPEMMTDEGKIKLGFKPKDTNADKKDDWE
tara:strand:+ start:499 stop:840 length:342 start_codon:yes stop_codon:yes gene_type:complete